MNKKNKLTLCIILVFLLLFLSFILLFSFLKKEKENTPNFSSIESDEQEKIEDSASSPILEVPEESNSSSNPVNSSSNTDVTSNNNQNTNSNSSSNQSSNISSNQSSNQSSNISSNQSNSNSNTQSINSSSNSTSTAVDKNDTRRKEIENKYGITIKYGDEIGSYKPKHLTPTKMTDEDKIANYLEEINKELAKYPSGFFRDFKGTSLTIYLVDSVPSNSFVGFTDKEFRDDIKITLVDNYLFNYTLNHEIMHYIDSYLEVVLYPQDIYAEYMALNPSGYTYGSAVAEYNYGYNGQYKGAYFISSYAQTNVLEDRAEVFKMMMTRVYKATGMFDDGEVLQSKAFIIEKQIKDNFPSASGTQYWDKIIR